MPLVSLSYEEAIENNRRDNSHWPRDPESQALRLKPFCTPELKPGFKIGKDDLIFTIGSCFARNVEQHLIIEGFNVAVTQFDALCEAEGVKVKSNTLNKFVAQSILNELRWALVPNTTFPDDSIVEVRDGRFLDMQLAAGLMPAAHGVMLGMRRAVSNYMKMVADAKVVIITMGLAEAWFDKEYGIYMNTMPLKQTIDRYPGRFEFHVLEYNELLAAVRDIVSLLETYGHPDFRMLLTVSPVALGSTFTDRDALVANCYSKSVQRAVAEAVTRENPRVDYLPSYESITLSERSVAWREDGAHVSDDAVRLNVLRMQKAYAELPQNADMMAPTSSIADRSSAIALCKFAMTKMQAGDLNGAESLFAEAAEIAPDEVLVRVRWGLLLYKQQKYEEAANQLSLAMSFGGRSYNVSYTLAKALSHIKDYEGAEKALQIALEDEPDQARVVFLMAKTLERLNRKEEAVKFYHKATHLDPTNEKMKASYDRIEQALKAKLSQTA